MAMTLAEIESVVEQMEAARIKPDSQGFYSIDTLRQLAGTAPPGRDVTLADIKRGIEMMHENGLPPDFDGYYTVYAHPNTSVAKAYAGRIAFGCRVKTGKPRL